MYTNKTKQGYKIIHTVVRNNKVIDIIFKRRDGDYGIGRCYDPQSGVWDFVHYDFKTAYDALVQLIKLNEDLTSTHIIDQYERIRIVAYNGIAMYEEDRYQTCNENYTKEDIHEGVLADFGISEEEYNGMIATLELSSNPVLRDKIFDSLEYMCS